MDKLFDEARHKRRNREYILTSTYSNVRHYGSPVWSNKKSIWPPLSDDSVIASAETANHGFSTISSSTAEPILTASGFKGEGQSRNILDKFDAMTDVLYHPLHHGSMIRVLEIEPGRFKDPIICRFHYVDFETSQLDYEALSYVWGKPHSRWEDSSKMRQVIVRCNGHQLGITQNLEQAIRHIRLNSKPSFLWADAMCINQEDVEERGHQVTLMASIYRKAQKVIIWLGETYEQFHDPPPPELEDVRAQCAFGAICGVVNHWRGKVSSVDNASYWIANRSDQGGKQQFNNFENYPSSVANSDNPERVRQAMKWHGLGRPRDMIHDLGGRRDMIHGLGRPRDMIRFLLGSSADGDSPESEEEVEDPGLNANEDSAKESALWRSLGHLFSRSWFWRVWVIQEVILAPSAIARWGHAEIDWKWIGLASAILRTNYHKICETMHMGGVYNAYFMFRISSMSDLQPLRLSFIQLLRLTRQFEVTDTRDRVYGLLGIRTTDNDPETGSLYLKPDYSISDSELWKRLAYKVIRESQTLSLLSSVQYTTDGFEAGLSSGDLHSLESDDQYPTERLPSWVPHWEVVYRSTLAPWDHDDRFAAAKSFPLSLRLDSPVSSDSLLVEGVQIGVIGKCCSYMWHDVDTSLLESKAVGGFFASDDGLRLLARTLAAGRNSYGSLAEAGYNCLADFAAYVLDCDTNTTHGSSAFNSSLMEMSWNPRRVQSFRNVFRVHPHLEERLRKLAADGDASRFRETAIPACERRRLFLTLNGFLGLGSDSVVEGDILCVLSGGDLPFVLRPVVAETRNDGQDMAKAADGGPEVDHYLLVGECYVEGLMQGEGVLAVGGEICEFAGPIPFELVEEDILTTANEHAPLDAGLLFTPAMLEKGRRNRTEKKWFDIH